MQHPAQYTTVPWGGMHIMVVDAGTVVKDERSGEEITVDDKTVAAKGPVLYCTKFVFDAIKAVVPAASGALAARGGLNAVRQAIACS